MNRSFSVIAFDWDGTAVTNRQSDATAVRHSLDRLLRLGRYVVVITGTNFTNVDRQLNVGIDGEHKQRLFVCTNRGSEVFGFDRRSQPRLVFRHEATEDENQRLSAIAERVRRIVEGRTGLEVDIVYNRLNRRKIDVIPLPEWRDPPKEKIGELMRAVDERLRSHGLGGGLREVIALAEKAAVDEGMPAARITSDVKHVEVGLTDKGDSVEWMMREIVAKAGLSASDVLIAGDEFGPIDGFQGSDGKMIVPAAKGAVYVSVGKEPHGVPASVIHLGGGPPRFIELLDDQVTRHEAAQKVVSRGSLAGTTAGSNGASWGMRDENQFDERGSGASSDSPDSWLLIEEGFSLAREHEIESIFSVGNGYLGTRGSLAEGSAVSRPATFLAGIYDFPPGWSAGRELAKASDWTVIRVFVAGEELRLDRGETLDHRRILDLKRGVLRREWRYRDPAGRITRLSYLRFASLADRHTLGDSVEIEPENYGATIAVECAVDGALAGPGDVEVSAQDERLPVLTMRVAGSGVEIAFAMSTMLDPREDGELHVVDSATGRSLVHRWEWPARLGQTYRVDKLVSVHTSRDGVDPARSSARALDVLVRRGPDGLLQDHVRAFEDRWRACDLEVAGDADDQRGARFAAYHLISAANPNDPEVSIGARGLTGEAYKGHVFWDTEIFMLPFYTFTEPAAARSLLRYRHLTLPAARDRARKMGYRGALYAWESTTNGEDVTPRHATNLEGKIIPILCGLMEHHISADVAYAAHQYWQATGDDPFWLESGAEIVVETARFWVSRGAKEADGRFHIRHVIGPDEYHEDVDDNAFTNVMAQWNLEQGVLTAERLREQSPDRWRALRDQMALADDEVAAWRRAADDMYTGFDAASGLFEQFSGFFALQQVDLAAYEPRSAPLDVILGRPRTQASQVIKQPDVLMMLYLLWDRFPTEVHEINFRYYEPRCDHGSSLSPGIHAAFAAALGDTALARRYYRQTVEIDLANNMGNSASGVHLAALGALWQAVAFGFGRLELHEDHPSFDPRLPSPWQSAALRLGWRNRRLRLMARRDPPSAEVALEHGEPMLVALGDDPPRLIGPKKPRVVRRERRRAKEMA